ncbi:VQ protein [Dillenia turbinata]|uniref:VQ protein n=1 Tax=Dillenia turbinata TaxID=194707 RepID=A0AAN8ZST2_9MAGN
MVRKELNGRRPPPLAVNKHSTTIKKSTNHVRSPIIVYLRSPKVIHVKPQEFMGLVQRLTGNKPSTTISHSRATSPPPPPCLVEDHDGDQTMIGKRYLAGENDHQLTKYINKGKIDVVTSSSSMPLPGSTSFFSGYPSFSIDICADWDDIGRASWEDNMGGLN